MAMRSAEAAKNTSNLIENTIKAVQNGSELTKSTQEALKGNIAISGKISQLVDEIATASQEQAHGIAQINQAVSEMDKIVQQSAANAEQSASVSTEMKHQVNQLKNSFDELISVVGEHVSSVASTRISPSTKANVNIKPGNKTVKETHKALTHSVPKEEVKKKKDAPALKTTKPLRPEQVIPFDDAEFKDF